MFAERRREFMERMGDGVALFPSAPVRNRNGDVEYDYRQDSDLHYLTGFPEPEALAILMPRHPKSPFTLLVRPRDREKEIWNGRRAGVEGAIRDYGADQAFENTEMEARLTDVLGNQPRLYYRFGRHPEMDALVHRILDGFRAKPRLGVNAPTTYIDPAEILHEMRLRKSEEDLALLRKAAAITCEAHREAMRAARPGVFEYEVQASLEYVFRKSGASGPGYGSIVGSGANATILHYRTNDRRMEEGDLLLVDAAAEYACYTADVTRTFPVSGTFATPQREIYDLVLEAQKRSIAAVRPGATIADVHAVSVRTLTEGLIRLGLLSGDVDEAIAQETYRKFYMHQTSHWLGLDVHDVGAYRNGDGWRHLEPGMVLTIEPGLYVGEDLAEVDAKYRGIGVRIEDDVVVTPSGCENLTASAPKEVSEIEKVMRERG